MSTNEILGLFLAALTLGTVSYGIIKKYKSQVITDGNTCYVVTKSS